MKAAKDALKASLQMDAHPGNGVVPDVDNEPMVHMLIGLREVVQQRPGCSLGQQADETVPAHCHPKLSTSGTSLPGYAFASRSARAA